MIFLYFQGFFYRTKNEKGQGPVFNRSNLFASLVEELTV